MAGKSLSSGLCRAPSEARRNREIVSNLPGIAYVQGQAVVGPQSAGRVTEAACVVEYPCPLPTAQPRYPRVRSMDSDLEISFPKNASAGKHLRRNPEETGKPSTLDVVIAEPKRRMCFPMILLPSYLI